MIRLDILGNLLSFLSFFLILLGTAFIEFENSSYLHTKQRPLWLQVLVTPATTTPKCTPKCLVFSLHMKTDVNVDEIDFKCNIFGAIMPQVFLIIATKEIAVT